MARFRDSISASLLLLLSSCMSYRLQYEEDFQMTDESQPSKDRDGDETYRYLYEESFPKPAWFAWSCGFTFFYYGGACWFYLMSHDKDVENIRVNGHEKLAQILGQKKPKTISSRVHNFRSTHRHLPPRLRVFDPKEQTILRGEAASIHSLSLASTVQVDDDDDDEDVIDPYDKNFSYQSFQLGFHSGTAAISSHVVQNGQRSKIAAGTVPYRTFEFRSRFLSKNGWYWSWAPNLTAQTLTINDFKSKLPLYQSTQGYDIPVVISDPKDGKIVSDYVNSYKVGLRTAGLLLGGGLSHHWKLENEANFWSLSATAWVSALDYMQTDVTYSSRVSRRNYFATLQSYQVNLDGYYHILDWRLAIGFHVMNRIFPNVRMPDDMEFRGPARYDPGRNVFERPRLYIDDLEFTSKTFGMSLSYIFEELKFND